MATTKLLNNSSTNTARMRSIYRMSDAQPDWAQDDPSQPDYIKNKEYAERFRPISVNGQEVLADTSTACTKQCLCRRVDADNSAGVIQKHQSFFHVAGDLLKLVLLALECPHLLFDFQPLGVDAVK